MRSTGRATLEQTIESIDRQTYAACEIVLVDVMGAGHRPLEKPPRRHPLRIVELGKRLLRPMAANVGLDHARGEWIGFLDDDDYLDPEHVANLVAAAAGNGGTPVYSATRILLENDRPGGVASTPFNLLALHYENFLYFASVLFPHRMLEQGCRFDESLEVLEDWDFWLQVAQHTPLILVPEATANYRATTGTSGASVAQGAPTEVLRLAWEAMQAKWGGRAATIWGPIEARLREGIVLHQSGDLRAAMEIYREIQRLSPNEPSSLHALARAHLDLGEIEAARNACDVAIKLAPRNSEFLQTRALIARASSVPGMRNELCPCGSGKRFKHCCGRLD